MGAFNTKTVLLGNPDLIPAISDRICQVFSIEGYEIKREELLSGGAEISITKGGAFKAILGMKTALKITLLPQTNAISFQAGVGIFGKQIIPTLITMLYYWPVLITQIWGLVKQSNLDDKALAVAKTVIAENSDNAYGATSPFESTLAANGPARFCDSCGAPLAAGAKFCSNCGKPIS
ncbi:MAG: zinc ribbon domain-containing protein [Clostridiales bacterium]|nr:zinc ribbon domain-containing protein [Clostridiales bacterium]